MGFKEIAKQIQSNAKRKRREEKVTTTSVKEYAAILIAELVISAGKSEMQRSAEIIWDVRRYMP